MHRSSALFSHQMGSGVVGGPILSVEEIARDTASIGVRLLSGESAATIKTSTLAAQRAMYDWRELQRWGISEALLPAGSTILFRQPGVWDQYKPVHRRGSAVRRAAECAHCRIGRSARQAPQDRDGAPAKRTAASARGGQRESRISPAGLITAQEVERTRIARDLHDDVSQQLAGVSIAFSGVKQRLGDVSGQ